MNEADWKVAIDYITKANSERPTLFKQSIEELKELEADIRAQQICETKGFNFFVEVFPRMFCQLSPKVNVAILLDRGIHRNTYCDTKLIDNDKHDFFPEYSISHASREALYTYLRDMRAKLLSA